MDKARYEEMRAKKTWELFGFVVMREHAEDSAAAKAILEERRLQPAIDAATASAQAARNSLKVAWIMVGVAAAQVIVPVLLHVYLPK